MNRGDIFFARLDPVEGSEQGGERPVVLVSRDAINRSSPTVVVVPCTTYRSSKRLYPSHVVLRAPDGGLKADSVALGEQVRAISKQRLGEPWGTLSSEAIRKIDRALLVTLNLSQS